LQGGSFLIDILFSVEAVKEILQFVIATTAEEQRRGRINI
jgi:hypothetical protein